ncbi:hypothetical protein ACWEWX_11260 [Streptomyces asiaticus]
MAVGIFLLVVAVIFSTPYIVSWVWPSVGSTVLVVGNLFLGMVLGSAGIVGFMAWRLGVKE